jgi:hypothetical protein
MNPKFNNEFFKVHYLFDIIQLSQLAHSTKKKQSLPTRIPCVVRG